MLKIIYAGTPEFAVPALQALIDSDHQVVAVYTQPDRPAGRGRKLQPGPVKACASRHGIPLVQPESFRQPSDVERLQSFAADLMVVAAYGILLPLAVLQAPRLGCINIHGSLLPRWRGAAPIQRAILAGDRQTGITLMQMDEGLDTGAMLAKSTIDITPQATSAWLHDELMRMGSELLIENLAEIEAGTVSAQPQDDAQACYARKLSKQEGLIDWQQPAEDIQRAVRAFNPWPVSHSYLDGQSVKIWSAEFSVEQSRGEPGRIIEHSRQGIKVSCGKGVLIIDELQFAGKKRGSAEQLLNSRDLSSQVFGSQ